MLTSGVVQVAGLIGIGVLLVIGYATLLQIEESAARIAELTNKNKVASEALLCRVSGEQ